MKRWWVWVKTAGLLTAGAATLACSSSSSGGGGPGPGSQSQLRLLAEEFPQGNANSTKQRLDALSVEEHFILEYVGKQFKPTVFLRSCGVDSQLHWSYLADGTIYDCAKADKEWKDYVAWANQNGQDPNQNAELGRGDVLIYLKCRSGEIDQGSCQLYNNIKDQIAQDSAKTSQVIIDNIGNKCTVGKDPGCYP